MPSIKRQIRDLEESMKILFENPSIKQIFENLLTDADKSLEQQIALATRKGLFFLFFLSNHSKILVERMMALETNRRTFCLNLLKSKLHNINFEKLLCSKVRLCYHF